MMTLQVLVRLVKGSSIIGTKANPFSMVKAFVDNYGDSVVRDDWQKILEQLDAPVQTLARHTNVAGIKATLKHIADDKRTPTLKVLYKDIFLDFILKDKYYLPSEALDYFCGALSYNISLWYPLQLNPGSYLKMEEFGVEHKTTFMLRLCSYGLNVTQEEGSEMKWNCNDVNEIRSPHFDVLFLNENGVFDLLDEKDVLLCTAKLSPSYELLANTDPEMNSIPIKERFKQGEMTFVPMLKYRLITNYIKFSARRCPFIVFI
jgi:hypothetical protein